MTFLKPLPVVSTTLSLVGPHEKGRSSSFAKESGPAEMVQVCPGCAAIIGLCHGQAQRWVFTGHLDHPHPGPGVHFKVLDPLQYPSYSSFS